MYVHARFVCLRPLRIIHVSFHYTTDNFKGEFSSRDSKGAFFGKYKGLEDVIQKKNDKLRVNGDQMQCLIIYALSF